MPKFELSKPSRVLNGEKHYVNFRFNDSNRGTGKYMFKDIQKIFSTQTGIISMEEITSVMGTDNPK